MDNKQTKKIIEDILNYEMNPLNTDNIDLKKTIDFSDKNYKPNEKNKEYNNQHKEITKKFNTLIKTIDDLKSDINAKPNIIIYTRNVYKMYIIFVIAIINNEELNTKKDKQIKEGYELFKSLLDDLNEFYKWINKNNNNNISIDDDTVKEIKDIKALIQDLYKTKDKNKLKELREKYVGLKEVWDTVEKYMDLK